MAGRRSGVDEIVNINVGGKKYTVRRSTLCADPNSRLGDWFKPGSSKGPAQDKSGNYFLDRDGKTFRHIIAYLRFKREKTPPSLALPSKPDDLSRLAGEAGALGLQELQDDCMEMLQRYQREEQGHVVAFVALTIRDLDSWQFDKSGGGGKKVPGSGSNAYDDW